MTDRPMTLDDQSLESALRSLSSAIDWPTAAPSTEDVATGPDIATRVRVRLSSEDRRRSREAGFNHHLTKPPDPDILAALLESPQTLPEN